MRILSSIGLSIFLIPKSFAEIKVIHPTNDRHQVIVEADDCNSLKLELEAIRLWKLSRDKKADPILLDCTKTPEIRNFDVAGWIPTASQSIYKKSHSCDGPNCYNAAFIDASILDNPRHVGELERDRLLENCTPRKHGNLPQPGDVGILYGNVSSPPAFHGFIYISPNLVASKSGFTTESSFDVEPLHKNYSIFLAHQKNCINLGKANTQKMQCDKFVDYFDCTQKQKAVLDPKVANYDKEVSACIVDPHPNLRELATKLHEIQAIDPIKASSYDSQIGYKNSLLTSEIDQAVNKKNLDEAIRIFELSTGFHYTKTMQSFIDLLIEKSKEDFHRDPEMTFQRLKKVASLLYFRDIQSRIRVNYFISTLSKDLQYQKHLIPFKKEMLELDETWSQELAIKTASDVGWQDFLDHAKKMCLRCHVPAALDDLFCSSCGNKLKD